jgi:two-component system response regulator DctR
MDIHMPGLNGWEAHQKFRETGSNRPAIFIPADKDGNLQENAFKAGAVGFLQKPFNDHALVDLIKVVFEKKEKI